MSGLFCRKPLERGTSELLRSILTFLYYTPRESREASWDFHYSLGSGSQHLQHPSLVLIGYSSKPQSTL